MNRDTVAPDARDRTIGSMASVLLVAPVGMMAFSSLGILRARLHDQQLPEAGALLEYLVRNAAFGLVLGTVYAIASLVSDPRRSVVPLLSVASAMMVLHPWLEIGRLRPLHPSELGLFVLWVAGLIGGAAFYLLRRRS